MAAHDRLGRRPGFAKEPSAERGQHALAAVQPPLPSHASHGPGLCVAPCYGCHPPSAGRGRDGQEDLSEESHEPIVVITGASPPAQNPPSLPSCARVLLARAALVPSSSSWSPHPRPHPHAHLRFRTPCLTGRPVATPQPAGRPSCVFGQSNHRAAQRARRPAKR
ncbi:hypothetical protein K505DRAFT_135632 [Melanomma pulvis-pyrius CBS 109.77]|uniref:Uncharacterized protein n=1 Tax=Melanomma pulvis-pyrius CBS 109.77 TaxID=1314802 RepID=A0A6A6WSS7_9PLEO|nr:hypothetical protein K505DRAFT_135632 [Melanomma pulvis-pyrius CBS 109.77]